MYHSVKFNNDFPNENTVIDTYSDWHLVPESRPVVPMPEVNTNYVDVPGMSGSIDLTEYLTGYPTYKNRTGSLKFHVLNGYNPWQVTYHNIANYLHGKEAAMMLEDDPNYYYFGRFTVQSWTSNNDGTWSDVEIGYTLDPYKYYNQPRVITATVTSSDQTFYINTDNIGSMPAVSEIVASNVGSSRPTITFTNPERGISSSHTLPSNGSYRFYEWIITNLSGTNRCTYKIKAGGSGTIRITTPKGEL